MQTVSHLMSYISITLHGITCLLCSQLYYHDLDTLSESVQYDLFHHSRHSAHCLNHLYTTKLKPPGAMRLRPCGHDFELPTVKFEFNKQNFIVCSLFQYV